jgi:hypothetical protein
MELYERSATAVGIFIFAAMDLVNLTLSVRRIVTGKGCSPLPVIPLLGYSYFAILCRESVLLGHFFSQEVPLWLLKTGDVLLLAALHFGLVFWIPAIVQSRRRAKEEAQIDADQTPSP